MSTAAAAPGRAAPGVGLHLVVLTAAKWVSNVGYRWPSVFLPTLQRAFGTSTGTLTTVMGVAELGGLSTSATGHWLDRGHERNLFVAGMCAVAAGSLIGLGGSTATFAIGFAAIVIGVGNLTVAGQTWVSHRYEFTARGRAIGVLETSWALALLIGAPVLAALIDGSGWRAPFVAVALAAGLVTLAVLALVPADQPTAAVHRSDREALPRSAYLPMVSSAATAAAGLGLLVVSGAWLDERHGVSTGGLGAIAALSGGIELVSSSGVALVADRIGARRSVFAGLGVVAVGIAVMATSGDSRTAAVVGLLVFLFGFEYGFVSSLTVVTEAAPGARGRAIGLSNAISTVARAASVVMSGRLFDAFGLGGSLVWVGIAASVAVACLALSRPAGRPGRPD